jgi:hypothetical protein
VEHLAVLEQLHKIDCKALRHNASSVELQHAGGVMVDAARALKRNPGITPEWRADA